MSTNDSSPKWSPFLPLLLAMLALLTVLIWQFLQVRAQNTSLNQVAKTRETTVRDAQSVQGELQRLAVGLVELAKTDPQAKALVQKYGIAVDPAKTAK